MTTSNNLAVNVLRSKAVETRVQIAKELKQELIKKTKEIFPDVLNKKNIGTDKYLFLCQVESSAESFDVLFDAYSPPEVDRTISMLSGPFFTSIKHPIPTVNSEMLYPIVQIDLRVASLIIDEPLGDGLLQLWYDINECDGIVRVIPRTDVSVSMATEFNFVPAKDFDGFPLPDNWGSDPLGNEIQVMSRFKSTGVTCQQDHPEIYLDGVEEEVPEELYELLGKFLKTTQDKSSSDVHLFGTFYPIQYSAADAKGKCLINIDGDWGSSGNAQIFYDIDNKGNVTFSFWDSLR